MSHFPQIASRVLNTPLLLEPGYARVFFSALSSRLNIVELQDAGGQVDITQKPRIDGRTLTRTRQTADGYTEVLYHITDGAAQLDVKGTLVHKHGYLKPYSGMTGYDGIINRAAMMFADQDVKGVLMDMHTPGGEVAGCFDTVDQLRRMAAAAGKPLWSLGYDMHCSAGMALASAADRRLITQTGIAGSVGVVMAHASYQERLKEEGIKVTLIHSGAHKVEGNPYEDLPDEVLQRFQRDTAALRQQFAELVARHTGLTVEAVLATEAACYRGQEAVDIGFAHQLVNGHEALAEFSEYLASQGRIITTGARMSPATSAAPAAAAEQQPAATTQPAAPAADLQGAASAAGAERARVKGILCHAEAEGRGALAEHLAYDTDMSIEQAAAALAAAPRAQAANLDANTALDRLMASEEQPKVDAATDGGKPNKAQAIAGAWAKATGAKLQ